jgi:hypothetical protein
MFFTAGKSSELQEISGEVVWLTLTIVGGIIVFAWLSRAGQAQTSSLEFAAREFYDP